MCSISSIHDGARHIDMHALNTPCTIVGPIKVLYQIINNARSQSLPQLGGILVSSSFFRFGRRFGMRCNLENLFIRMNQCSARVCSRSLTKASIADWDAATLGLLSKAHLNMRVVSSLSCFAAASPLLRSQLPFTTTATSSNDVQQLRNTHLGRPSMHAQRPKQESHLGQNNSWLRLDSGCNNYNPALVTRGGAAVSKTQPERSPYDQLKAFLNKRFFLLGAAAMVAAAKVAPSPGTTGGLLSLSVSKAGEGGLVSLGRAKLLSRHLERMTTSRISLSRGPTQQRIPPCVVR